MHPTIAMPERLQRIIARAGITSRRKAEILISDGRVALNGVVVTTLGTRADPAKDTVAVDGKVLAPRRQHRYLALYKPKGCITTTSDPQGRTTVMDLLGTEASAGLFPVGRLDYNTEGLLILTNDGDLANRVTSARNAIPKTYQVKVSGRPSWEALQQLRHGIRIQGRRVRPQSIRPVRMARNPWFEIVLIGGRNRQIHRMFQRIGHLVEKIRRVAIGRLTLAGLEPRQVRALDQRDLRRLVSTRPPERSPDVGSSERRRARTPLRRSAAPGGRERRYGQRRGSPGRGRGQAGKRPAGRPRGRAGGSPARGGRRRAGPGPVKRGGTPHRSRGRHRPTGGGSRARGGPGSRGPSRRRSPAQSRARRSSRRGSRPGP